MHLSYSRYLDQILGGWIGKSMGGAIGARFEGNKSWIEISPSEMFPPAMPPNDDLDLQVLWLKVLEEKGPALASDDLAAAWLEGCWYPFNEYGIFRRNWRLGIHPPASGRFTNQFWETGEGCPIRAEIWGYVFPGAPDLAAHHAAKDGVLDHTEQSVGAEMMLAAMASMAFFIPDVRRLVSMFMHYLPPGSPVERLTRAAFQAHDAGLTLREARDRLMALGGLPEACDAQINVPFTFLGLLYGGNDVQETMLAALRCGYDTDCTLASAAALAGQILGASRIPAALKEPVGDELVMGIAYHRPEMTLTALARDTARVGVLLGQACSTGVTVEDAPELAPAPQGWQTTAPRLRVEYEGLPAAAPGERMTITVYVDGAVTGAADAGQVPTGTTFAPARAGQGATSSAQAPQAGTSTESVPAPGTMVSITPPDGWTAVPARALIAPGQSSARVTLHAPLRPEIWPARNLFGVGLDTLAPGGPAVAATHGIAGAGLYRFLGVYYDAMPDADDAIGRQRAFNQHFVSLQREYIPEPEPDVEALTAEWSRLLGRPALLHAYQHEVDITRLIGLRGPLCAYLSRTILSPDERPVYLVVGNTDAYRLYLNGDRVAEVDEVLSWAPFNNVHAVRLRQGENRLLLKLLRRSDAMRFTLGIRENTGRGGQNAEDWVVDLADAI